MGISIFAAFVALMEATAIGANGMLEKITMFNIIQYRI